MLTYSQRKTFARHGAQNLDATVDAAVEAVAAQQKAERLAATAEYRRRTAPVPFTPEQLAAATHIRTNTGWHKVIRVNTKSVTVETPYSWTDRHPITRILEVRTAAVESGDN